MWLRALCIYNLIKTDIFLQQNMIYIKKYSRIIYQNWILCIILPSSMQAFGQMFQWYTPGNPDEGKESWGIRIFAIEHMTLASIISSTLSLTSHVFEVTAIC